MPDQGLLCLLVKKWLDMIIDTLVQFLSSKREQTNLWLPWIGELFSSSMHLVRKEFLKAIKEIIAANLTIKHISLMT